MSKKIVLVGSMGAGKSTIGRLLARQLQLPFKDTDSVIEERSGADIPWIFDVEGEQGFRLRETAVLRDMMALDDLVLATGGGIVLKEENRQLLKQADVVVYLAASPEQLYKRTEKDSKRPLLQVERPLDTIKQLVAERDPLYREVATRVIITGDENPKVVVNTISADLI